ncbi:MAG: DUF192 domain-containing protein [Candidatus Moraniibacteriota bacterium]
MNTIQSRKNNWKVLGATLCFLAIIFWYTIEWRSSHLAQSVVRIGDRQFLVELADTPALRERGLGYRETLLSGHGMLFLFPDRPPDRYAFWMKGMRFPLDIAWIRDGQVVFIERNIPAESEDIFRPLAEADSVLEVNAGDLSHVVTGDAVVVSDQ